MSPYIYNFIVHGQQLIDLDHFELYMLKVSDTENKNTIYIAGKRKKLTCLVVWFEYVNY